MQHDNEHQKQQPEKLPGVIVVIPAYNEELVIGSVVLQAVRIVEKVIVVDDGSTDATSEIATAAGAEVIRFQQPSGKGAACIEGLKRAYQIGCSIAILIDGDARYNAREIPGLISPIQSGKADVAIGSRYLEADGTISVRQLIIQNIISLPNNKEKQITITDPLSGFIALNRKSLEDLNFSFTPHEFKQRFIEHLIKRKLRIHEVAVTERPGVPKKVGWDDSVKVVAALPAFNEEKYIAKIIAGAQDRVDAVMVIDDGSSDATAAIARQMGAYVVSHEKNRGYGAALQTIFTTAKNLNLEAVVILDADGQHNPADIDKLLTPLQKGAGLVIGSRFIDKTKNNIPFYRKIGMKVLDIATASAGGKKGIDTQSGFRAYGKKAINIINISISDMSASSEILIQISDHNLKIAEVPISVRYDIKNTSTQNPIYHGISVLGSIIARISYRRPLPAFGIPGLILFIIGIAWGIFAFYNYEISRIVSLPLSLLSAVFIFFGLTMGIAGLILNAVIHIRVENR